MYLGNFFCKLARTWWNYVFSGDLHYFFLLFNATKNIIVAVFFSMRMNKKKSSSLSLFFSFHRPPGHLFGTWHISHLGYSSLWMSLMHFKFCVDVVGIFIFFYQKSVKSWMNQISYSALLQRQNTTFFFWIIEFIESFLMREYCGPQMQWNQWEWKIRSKWKFLKSIQLVLHLIDCCPFETPIL